MDEAGERALERIGIMGGTFDPLHVGHLVAATEAMHAFRLDLVVFVPTGAPWQKSGYSDPEDRFMMAMLATEGHRSFAVSRVELDRRGPTYTADTIDELREFYGGDADLFFIVGADSISRLATWEHLDRLVDRVEMIAVTRPGFEMNGVESKAGWPRVHVLEVPGIAVSATDIRERVRQGRPIDFLVPPAVLDYIRKQGLYA